MYVTTRPEEVLERNDDESASSCHCWCNRTLTLTGPDDRPAHKGACHSSRSCFEE
jgi:hypothetical protein